MRVIAGKYKGRRINPPLDNSIRPTTDKIKESLFSILRDDTEDAVVIDLFAGTGGLGIEALSRGAKKVYFCDIDGRSIALLKSNLTFCPSSEYEIIKGDFSDCVRRLAARGVKADIIICDPPYDKKLGNTILSEIKSADILKKGGAITVERATDDEKLSEREFFNESVHKYGNITVEVFRNWQTAAVTGTFDPFTKGHEYLVGTALKQFDAVYVVMLVNENKVARYSVEKRLKMAEIALRPFKKRVKVEFYDGMAIDYCKDKGIRYIIRGIRTPSDTEYEREMAEYNFNHGGVETVFVAAKDSYLSSSLVRERIDGELPVDGLVDENIENYLK